MKKSKLSKAIMRNTVRHALYIITIYVLYNVFYIFILDYQLEGQLDHQIDHEMEHILMSFTVDHDSLIVVNPLEFQESDLSELTESPFFMLVYSPEGEVLMRSFNMDLIPPIPVVMPDSNVFPYYKTIRSEIGSLRVGYEQIFDVQHNLFAYVQLATPRSAARNISRNIILFNLFSFPLLIVVIIMVSVYLAKWRYAPINKIIDLSDKITAKNLKERLEIDPEENDEIIRLKSTLNHLFDRLENQIGLMSSFTDNASHQLMSPLTVLQAELEYILKKACDKEKCWGRETLLTMRDQTERMIRMVNTMLIMAKDYNQTSVMRSVFNLSKLINDDIVKMFTQKNILYEIEKDIYLRGDKDYFSMVLQNLLGNAVKYSEEDSEILVKANRTKAKVTIRIEDYGSGIADNEKERIFEKFYRSKATEEKGINGFGLGLSFVQHIINSMGGTIRVEDNNPQGSIFIVELEAVRLS